MTTKLLYPLVILTGMSTFMTTSARFFLITPQLTRIEKRIDQINEKLEQFAAAAKMGLKPMKEGLIQPKK